MDAKEAYKQAHGDLALYANDFYSWCGDFVSGILAKAWRVNGKLVPKEQLRFLNRLSLNGEWKNSDSVNNLSMFQKEAMTPTTGLIAWHKPGSGYVPTPGDVVMFPRGGGGHIAFVGAFTSEKDFVTFDGKSFDNEWNKQKAVSATQGSCQNRRTGEPVTGWIDTAKLREALGYK